MQAKRRLEKDRELCKITLHNFPLGEDVLNSNAMINQAPIVLFVYNRPKLTRQTVEALRRNMLSDKSDLIIFSDGPKDSIDIKSVQEVRKYINTIDGFKTVTVIERETNVGLAPSIIDGVTKVCNENGRVIVLEDDLITSPYFLLYMNQALETYKDVHQVISIHGYIYPVSTKLPEIFFIKGADCWGWATWKRGWVLFENDGKKLLKEISGKRLVKEFNFNNSYDYTKMLRNQIKGKNDSWAIRWYASAFLRDKLTLYPGSSLVQNIGIGDSATHGSNILPQPQTIYDSKLATKSIDVKIIPIEESKFSRNAFEEFFRQSKPSIFQRLIFRFRKPLKPMSA
jgi:hypothetical protein